MQMLAYLSAPAYLLGYIPETGSAGSEDVLQRLNWSLLPTYAN